MSNALKVLVAGKKPLASDVNQLINALSGVADVGPLSLFSAIANPAAPSVAINASAGVLNGNYSYIQVNVTGWVATDGTFYIQGFAPSAASATVSPANQQVNVTLTVGPSGTIARLLYRPVAGGSTYKFAAWIGDNTTTAYTDNLADANLGTNIPGPSSTPAVNGTAIPSTAPTTNTTGTYLTPGIVSARNIQITGTTAQQILSWTPTRSGIYELKAYLRVITAATNITLTLTYTDSGGAQTYTPAALNNSSIAVGSHSVVAYSFETVASSPITLTVTAGTANQVYVTAALVPVA